MCFYFLGKKVENLKYDFCKIKICKENERKKKLLNFG